MQFFGRSVQKMRALKSIGAVAVFLCVLLMLQSASFADSVNIVQRDSYIKDGKGNLRFITEVTLDGEKTVDRIGTWVVPKSIFNGWDADNIVEIENDKVSTDDKVSGKTSFKFTADILNIPANLLNLEFYAKSYIVYKDSNNADKYVQAPLASENVNNSENTKDYSASSEDKANKPKYYDSTNKTNSNTTEEAKADVDKSFVTFEKKFENTDKYLYRVGNANAVALSSLFTANGTPLGIDVKITNKAGNAGVNNTTEETPLSQKTLSDTIQFTGTGVVEVAIKDSAATQYKCTLLLEVVDAINATSYAMSATSNNVVLLDDVGFSSVKVSNGYAIYGNGFKMTCSSDSVSKYRYNGFIELDNGVLDNVQVICPNFSHSILYDSNKTENLNTGDGDGRYYNMINAVAMNGSSKIINSYISGGRTAVYANGVDQQIINSTINGGAAANIQADGANTLLLKDVTTIQVPTKANVNDTTQTRLGLGVTSITGNTVITIEGTLRQYNWVNSEYLQYVQDSRVKSPLSTALGLKQYQHTIDDKTCINAGFVFIEGDASIVDKRVEKQDVPYAWYSGLVYSYTNANGTIEELKTEPVYTPNKFGDIVPKTVFTDESGEDRIYTEYYDGSIFVRKLQIRLPVSGSYTLDSSKLKIMKYGEEIPYTIYNGTIAIGQSAVFSDIGDYNYTLKFYDTKYYDKDGDAVQQNIECEYPLTISVSQESIDPPVLVSQNYGTALRVTSGSDYNHAVPALEGLSIKYYSKSAGNYVTKGLSDLTPTTSGKANGDYNYWEYTCNDFTLKITNMKEFKSGDNGAPFVYNSKLYFGPKSSSGLVGSGSTPRSPKLEYEFTAAGKTLKFEHTWSGLQKNSNPSVSYSTFSGSSSGGGSGSCLAEGTLITLADGSQKPIEDLTFDDELLVWDFFKGEYTVSQPSLLMDDGFTGLDTIKLKFSDNSDLTIVYEHGLYDVNEKNYIYINKDNVDSYIGHTFIKTDGIENKTVELVDYDIIEEGVHSYTLLTAFHNNCIANGILTVTPPPVPGWYDYFAIGDDMKYDAQSMMLDIAKYGLYEYEDLSDYVSHEEFCAFNGPYLKVLVGKGLITYDDIIEQIGVFMDTNSRRTLD